MAERERIPAPSIATQMAERIAEQCIAEGGSPLEYRTAARERAQATAQEFVRLRRPMDLRRRVYERAAQRRQLEPGQASITIRPIPPIEEAPEVVTAVEDVNRVFATYFGELEEAE